MDSARGTDDRGESSDRAGDEAAAQDVVLDVGGDERRMHVRAYNHWVSLLQGRAYPSIEDLDPTSISDFGPHSVLLDFSQGIEDPRIAFLGRALREECGIDAGIAHISEVPSRSLLSRLTDHYLQIIANRAPIGFEAEFVGTRGHNTMYRGILMPFSSDEDTIDYIYGVINWKELVDAATQAQLTADLAAARRAPAPAAAPIWADGPSAAFAAAPGDDHVAANLPDDATLSDRVAAARDSAAAFAASEGRSRTALYAALAQAHGIAAAAIDDPETYAELLEDAAIKRQARAPMTPIAKLVFGAEYDKTRLTEFASVLTHAARHQVGRDGLADYLESFPGGIKGIVGAERALRRKPAAPDLFDRIAAELRARPPLGHVDIPHGSVDGEFVVLLARADGQGGLDVVACVDGDKALTERTVRRAAA